MKKKLTVRNFAAIKRTAQNVNPLVVKKNNLLKKAEELVKEAKEIISEISGYEAGTMALTGGYTSEDLVRKVVESTGKVDKNNNPIKVTKYVPTERIIYNEEENCYYIEESDIEVPSTEDTPGSDFDIDSENVNVENEL